MTTIVEIMANYSKARQCSFVDSESVLLFSLLRNGLKITHMRKHVFFTAPVTVISRNSNEIYRI